LKQDRWTQRRDTLSDLAEVYRTHRRRSSTFRKAATDAPLLPEDGKRRPLCLYAARALARRAAVLLISIYLDEKDIPKIAQTLFARKR